MDKRVIPNYPILGPSYILLIGVMDPVSHKPQWALCGWNSTISYSHIMISFGLNHKTTEILDKVKHYGYAVSMSIVEREWLDKADLVGTKSSFDTNKSDIFEYNLGLDGYAPVPNCARMTITGNIDEVLDLPPCKNFILSIRKTFVNPEIENEKGLIDYNKFHPVLFTQPTFEYFSLGEKIGETEKLPFIPPELGDVLGGK